MLFRSGCMDTKTWGFYMVQNVTGSFDVMLSLVCATHNVGGPDSMLSCFWGAYGAANPDNAGINVKPPLSDTVFASCSTSGEDFIIPNLSRNH